MMRLFVTDSLDYFRLVSAASAMDWQALAYLANRFNAWVAE